jgi:hypothetical protein
MAPDNDKFYGQGLRDAHALAIGKIVMAWNEYHETLGEIYAEICGREKWSASLDDWHSDRNDAAQRSKLRKAALYNLEATAPALEAISWIIDTTDQILREQRNIGVHMPLMSFTDEAGLHQILPLTIFGNPRALDMVGRDILKEYAHFEDQIRRMFSYAIAIKFNISPVRQGPEQWPHKPSFSVSARDG